MGFVGFGSIMPIYMFFVFISYFCALYHVCVVLCISCP